LQEESPDRSGYYSGSLSSGAVNPAYTSTLHRKPGYSPDKPGHSVDGNSDSLFDDDIEEDYDDYIWDKNLDSGHVSNVSSLCYCFSSLFIFNFFFKEFK